MAGSTFKSDLRFTLLIILLYQLRLSESFASCQNRFYCSRSMPCLNTKQWTTFRSKDDNSDFNDANLRKISNFIEENTVTQQKGINSDVAGRSYTSFGNLTHFWKSFVIVINVL
jgi:hypothetical protein